MKVSLVSNPVQEAIEEHEIYTKKLGFTSRGFNKDAGLAAVVRLGAPDMRGDAVRTRTEWLFLVLVVIFAAGQGYAGPRVDLPGLLGEYSLGGEEPWVIPSTRATTFVLPDSIGAIEGLRVIGSGSWFAGQRLQCRDIGGVTYCDTIPWGVTLVFRLTSEAVPDGYFYAVDGAFQSVAFDDDLVAVGESGNPEFNLLLGSEIRAELYCNVPEEEVADYVVATHGELHEIGIEVTGAVPLGRSSWAGVKALFR